MSFSYVHQLNRPEPTVKYGQLPKYYQEFLKALWEQGVVLEVYGVKSRKWQPLHQRDTKLVSHSYYRVMGAEHCGVQKPGRTAKEQGQWVYITDPVALPENTVTYMSEGTALSATITKY